MLKTKLKNRIAPVSLAMLTLIATARFAAAQQTFNVKSFGATGNGTTLDTTAINNAIKAANNAGGGLVTLENVRVIHYRGAAAP